MRITGIERGETLFYLHRRGQRDLPLAHLQSAA